MGSRVKFLDSRSFDAVTCLSLVLVTVSVIDYENAEKFFPVPLLRKSETSHKSEPRDCGLRYRAGEGPCAIARKKEAEKGPALDGTSWASRCMRGQRAGVRKCPAMVERDEKNGGAVMQAKRDCRSFGNTVRAAVLVMIAAPILPAAVSEHKVPHRA